QLTVCAIVRGAVEQDNLARRREMRDIALDVNLRLLTVGGRRQCHVPVDARARAGGNSADHAALARRVAALENHDDTRTLGLNPSLPADEVHFELSQLLLEFLTTDLAGRVALLDCLVLLLLVLSHLECSLMTPSIRLNPRQHGVNL